MADEWLSVVEVGKRLGVMPRTVHSLLNKGELIGYRIARNYRVRVADVDAYLESARIVPGDLTHLTQRYDGVVDLHGEAS